MSIVRHLVDLHGGEVSAHSPGEGQGATFTVKLPLIAVLQIEDVEPRIHPRASDYLPQLACPERLDGLKILAADDEADTCELLKTMIEKCGGVVQTATSADEALSALEKERFDVIISDIGMAGKDGYQFIQEVRRLPVAEPEHCRQLL